MTPDPTQDVARVVGFQDLNAWKQARLVRRETFRLTRDQRFDVDRILRAQMRGASLSAMANVAEGFERGGDKQFLQFLAIAKGSAGELRSHAFAAFDSELLTEDEFNGLHAASLVSSRLIFGLIRRLLASRAAKPSLDRNLRESATLYSGSALELDQLIHEDLSLRQMYLELIPPHCE